MKNEDARAVFTTLQGIATSEVTKRGKFVIPRMAVLKLKRKPARPAQTRMIAGKEVKVAAKEASTVVKAFPAPTLQRQVLGRVKAAAKCLWASRRRI